MKTLLIVLFSLLLERETESFYNWRWLSRGNVNQCESHYKDRPDAGATKQDVAGFCKKDRNPILKLSIPI